MTKKTLMLVMALCLVMTLMTVTAFAADEAIVEPGTGHTITYFPALEATCCQNGSYEYWYCEECDVVYADAECTEQTNRRNLTIQNANPLTYVEAVEPTCHGMGNEEYYLCEECGACYISYEGQMMPTTRVTLPALGSENVTHVEAVAPVCHENGVAEHWYCADCDTYFADEACTEVTNIRNLTIAAEVSLEYFEGVEATCHGQGIQEHYFCPECGACYTSYEGALMPTNGNNVIIPPVGSENVVYVEGYEAGCHQTGLSEHWYCPDCDSYFDDEACTKVTTLKRLTIPAANDLAYVPGAEACHVPGIAEYWYCPECQIIFANAEGTEVTNRKNLEIEPVCGLTHVEAVAATADKNGCAEYWYCEKCEAVYADAEGKQLTNRMNLTIEATGEEEIPQTADSSIIILAVVALVSMACVVVLNKKKVA